MKRSTDRILTTHTGSLPRPSDLLPLIAAAESGNAADANRLQARVQSAVAEVVRKQVDAGVDIVNDGEASKPSYSTYVKDRLTGFEGEADVMAIADLGDYPEFGERFARYPFSLRRGNMTDVPPSCKKAGTKERGRSESGIIMDGPQCR